MQESVSTLLLNLQALLLELDGNLSAWEKRDLYQRARSFRCSIGEYEHSGTSPYPPLEAAATLTQAAPAEAAPPGATEQVARCFFSLSSHEEATLGYGVYLERGKLKSFGELISWSAFHEQGLRQTSAPPNFTPKTEEPFILN